MSMIADFGQDERYLCAGAEKCQKYDRSLDYTVSQKWTPVIFYNTNKYGTTSIVFGTDNRQESLVFACV